MLQCEVLAPRFHSVLVFSCKCSDCSKLSSFVLVSDILVSELHSESTVDVNPGTDSFFKQQHMLDPTKSNVNVSSC